MKNDPQVTIVITNLSDTVFSMIFERIIHNISMIAKPSFINNEFVTFKTNDSKETNVLIYSKQCERLTCLVSDESLLPTIYDAVKYNELIKSNSGHIEFHYTGCNRVYVDHQFNNMTGFGDMRMIPVYNYDDPFCKKHTPKFLAATVVSVEEED